MRENYLFLCAKYVLSGKMIIIISPCTRLFHFHKLGNVKASALEKVFFFVAVGG